jgi:hypothetical protein
VDVERACRPAVICEKIGLAKRGIGETMKPTSRPDGDDASANITRRIAFRQFINVVAANGAARAKRAAKKK